MNKTRLRLDFSLPTAVERQEFINNYIKLPEFKETPLTEDELEMIGNYLLWGKDNSGKNATQRKEIFIKTKRGDWDGAKAEDSLDELIENPAFNESHIQQLSSNHYKTPKVVFSRDKALKECPAELIPEFRTLFRRIDELDLLINYYDLNHGRRTEPPRQQLMRRFTEEEAQTIAEVATHLNPFTYLKKRHLLIDLRREQYSLQDTYRFKIGVNPVRNSISPIPQPNPSFDAEILIYPLGLIAQTKLSSLIFKDFTKIPRNNLSEEQLKLISDLYWEKQKGPKKERQFFDFSDPEHLYQLFSNFYDFHAARFDPESNSTVPDFFNTLEYYIKQANLDQIEADILQMKIEKIRNCDICIYLRKTYNKNYTQNYISTIFKKRIITKIAAAASYHLEIIENLFYPENFKECYKCHGIYLRDNRNFVKKKSSQDGLANRCKKCDKEVRSARNEKYKIKTSY